jgi:hypothetical protein
MMRKIFTLLLSLFLVLIPITSSADIQYSKYQWPPLWNGTSPIQHLPLTDYGFDVVDTFNSGSTDYSFIRVMTPNLQPFCSSLDDPGCQEIAKKYGWWIIRLLPPCKSVDEKSDCIEGLSTTDKSGKVTKYINTSIYKRSEFPADVARGLGEGSGTSVWVDPTEPNSGTGFAVTVSGDAGGAFDAKDFSLKNFAATVFAFKTVEGNYAPPVTRIVNQQMRFDQPSGSRWDPACLWITTGKCGLTSDYPEDTSLTLSLHLTTNLATWVLGRLGNPKIDVAELGAGYQRVSVSAQPILVPMIGGKVGISEATPEIKKLWSNNVCPECQHGIWAMNAPSSSESAFAIVNAFKPFLNDRSMVSIPAWSISSLKEKSPSLSKCTQVGSISGLVTTNASVYQGAPPTFDGTSLNYKVGAMHFTDNGEIFKGLYELLMPSKTAECLYGYSSAPVSASVSITSESGENTVATTVLSEKDGWLHLSAGGFTFSNPTIKVKFAKPTALPVATPTPSPTPTRQILKVQWCAKGNAKKKVTGTNPVCPKGYKKIPAPL